MKQAIASMAMLVSMTTWAAVPALANDMMHEKATKSETMKGDAMMMKKDSMKEGKMMKKEHGMQKKKMMKDEGMHGNGMMEKRGTME